ncbi:MAG TPA: DUF2339 domain-containing protein, partial [Phycisphaerales bacterium]|nr:DUF2339 domain-containing protein [Phycisphaerales bacterium]
MNPNDLERRLLELTERIDRIERHLAIPHHEPEPSHPPIAPPVIEQTSTVTPPPIVPAPVAPPPPPIPAEAVPTPPRHVSRTDAFARITTQHQERAADELRAVLDAAQASQASAGESQEPPVVSEASTPPSIPTQTTSQSVHRPHLHPQAQRMPTTSRPTLEFLIGGKWMAWIGAIVVVIAVGFAVKIGIDRGWWGHLGPFARCLMIAAFGALLLAAGEMALRRINSAASAGLFGAGLGTLYLDSYAAFNYFNLVDQGGAFLLMAIVALIGIAITYRTRFLTIGVLSMVAGYLTPMLVHSDTPHHVEFFLYLTMLLGISLVLSAICLQPFRSLRYVSLGGLGVMSILWSFSYGVTHWQLAVIFFSLWWGMILVESVLAALRGQSAFGNVFITLLSTASYVTLTCALMSAASQSSHRWTGEFTFLIALICASAAFLFGRGFSSLRSVPRDAIEKLALALWAQSGVLLATAVALHFKDYGQTIGWLAIAVASIEIARRLASRGVAVFGLVVGALALARIFTLDVLSAGADTPLITFYSITISRWSLLALAGFASLHAVAHRLREDPPAHWVTLPALLTCLATILWAIICMAQCHGLAITGGWLVCAAALLALESLGHRQRYLEASLVLLVATAARWLIVDAFLYRAS